LIDNVGYIGCYQSAQHILIFPSQQATEFRF